jgi:chemotaxis methyl-accepting protein methylase
VAADEQFDLVLATNILLYYDVFEQSLAVTNVARMLRPGGLFLTNDRVFELPAGPVRAVGTTDVIYMKQADGAQKGDRITWYQR